VRRRRRRANAAARTERIGGERDDRRILHHQHGIGIGRAPSGRTAYELAECEPHRLAARAGSCEEPARDAIVAGQSKRQDRARKLVAEHTDTGPRLAPRLGRGLIGSRGIEAGERAGGAERQRPERRAVVKRVGAACDTRRERAQRLRARARKRRYNRGQLVEQLSPRGGRAARQPLHDPAGADAGDPGGKLGPFGTGRLDLHERLGPTALLRRDPVGPGRDRSGERLNSFREPALMHSGAPQDCIELVERNAEAAADAWLAPQQPRDSVTLRRSSRAQGDLAVHRLPKLDPPADTIQYPGEIGIAEQPIQPLAVDASHSCRP